MSKYKVFVRKKLNTVYTITDDIDQAISLFKLLQYCANDSLEEIQKIMKEEGFSNVCYEDSIKYGQVLGLIVLSEDSQNSL